MTFSKDFENIKFEYRADIDGLRALAVVAVIFFHAGIPGFSGGFIGVDIFFVISGFLITSFILKEIHAGQFSIGKFYERRIRRIFPALYLVILFTTGVAAFLFDSETFQIFGKSLTATTLFGSNFLFVNAIGYFESDANNHPLLHTWSLAVEEQFYIIFPLLLIIINKFSKSRYLPWIVGAGLIPCIYGFGLNTSIKKISDFNQTIPYQVFLALFLLLYVSFFKAIYIKNMILSYQKK
jgi:peptidoglycan/LPS O-acetylase OafA/YrhL